MDRSVSTTQSVDGVSTTVVHTNCSCPICVPGKYTIGDPIPSFPNIGAAPYPYYTPSPAPAIQYGWVCPCCKSVYSPSVAKCFGCPAPTFGITLTGNSGTVELSKSTDPENQNCPPPTSE